MVPPRHRPQVNPPLRPRTPAQTTVPGQHRSPIRQTKPQYESLPNRFDPTFRHRAETLPHRRAHLPSNHTSTPGGSRESFRSDDSVFISGSLCSSQPLAQSTPNISQEPDVDSRASLDSSVGPPSRGRSPQPDVRPKYDRAPPKERARAHSLHRDCLIGREQQRHLQERKAQSRSMTDMGAAVRSEDRLRLDNRRRRGTRPDQYRADQYRPEQYRPDQCRSDQSRPDQYRPDQYRPDQCRSDRYKPDQCRSDRYRPDQRRPDQYRPETARTDDVTERRRQEYLRRRRARLQPPASESFDSDDMDIGPRVSGSGARRRCIQKWRRHDSSTDDAQSFCPSNTESSTETDRKHLFIKRHQPLRKDHEKSPVMTRIDWSPNRRRSCDPGPSPLLRHMKMRKATSCEHLSMNLSMEQGSTSFVDREHIVDKNPRGETGYYYELTISSHSYQRWWPKGIAHSHTCR